MTVVGISSGVGRGGRGIQVAPGSLCAVHRDKFKLQNTSYLSWIWFETLLPYKLS